MNKLLEFQKRVGAIKKDSVNPFFKSKYADINSLLDVVKPVLNQLGLLVVQPLGIMDGKNILTTRVYDDDKVLLESAIIIPDNLDPQKIGSAITYYRRYSLQSLLLLEAEDDDAESAKPKKTEIVETVRDLKKEWADCKKLADASKLWESCNESEKKVYRNAKEDAKLRIRKADIDKEITKLTAKNHQQNYMNIYEVIDSLKGEEKQKLIKLYNDKLIELGIDELYEPTPFEDK
jgi:hypothetical protein